MPSSILHELATDIKIYDTPAEDIPSNYFEVDEVWIFNLLQHVIDPDKLIENCKKWAKKIRFFEPVDQEISICHPHSPSKADFKRWFGDYETYKENNTAVNFHTAECIYGVWTNDNI